MSCERKEKLLECAESNALPHALARTIQSWSSCLCKTFTWEELTDDLTSHMRHGSPNAGAGASYTCRRDRLSRRNITTANRNDINKQRHNDLNKRHYNERHSGDC